MRDAAPEPDPLRRTELDATALPAFRERILAFEAEPVAHEPRTYPGVPRTALPAPGRLRPGSRLAHALRGRRSARALGSQLPAARDLGFLLALAHGVTGDAGRGPTPSAGGLQALELYLAPFLPAAWLPHAVFHYDRRAHALSEVAPGAPRDAWREVVPSLDQCEGGAALVVLAGDAARVAPKYGPRAGRFLLLEAGHLMQSLCILAGDAGASVLPLGGVCEAALAQRLRLPRGDLVLYAAVLGPPIR